MKNIFYFDILIEFESDYNVHNLEKIIGLKPYKILTRRESEERVKKAVVYEKDGTSHNVTPTAKFIYKSEKFSGIDVDSEFEKFIKSIDENLEKIIPILEENKGKISFSILLTEIKGKPCIYFNNEIIKIIAKYNSDLEVYCE